MGFAVRVLGGGEGGGGEGARRPAGKTKWPTTWLWVGGIQYKQFSAVPSNSSEVLLVTFERWQTRNGDKKNTRVNVWLCLAVESLSSNQL